MKSTTVGDVVFIHELAPPFERIEFQYCPDSITYSRDGAWVNVPIVGRNNSRKHLTGGEDRLNMQLDFSGFFEDNREHCIEKISFLNSLTMTDGFVGPSRNVKIAWANNSFFRHKIWIVKSVKSVMSDFHRDFNYNPMQALIDVEFELDPEENQKISMARITGYNARQQDASIVNGRNPIV